jgi:hypothetical protein
LNLSNPLLVGAIDICEACGRHSGIGLAFVVGVNDSNLITPKGNLQLLFGGICLVLGAIELAPTLTGCAKPSDHGGGGSDCGVAAAGK